jgi:hypothetical protein
VFDPESHPYPPHLLLGPAGKSGLASRPTCRSGRQTRVRQSPVRVPDQSLGTDPASDRSHSWGHGPWSSQPDCQSGLWADAAQMKYSLHVNGRLF